MKTIKVVAAVICDSIKEKKQIFATARGYGDFKGQWVHQGDPMVKDVCADCNNNKISYIDSYAKDFIEKYFVNKYTKDDVLKIGYEYSMIQKMCLKYAFNDLRSRKKDTSFFSKENIGFLLDENETEPLINVTVLAGLAVNTSPVTDYVFGNMKLRWSDSPIFCSNSIVMNVDYNTGNITLRDKMEIQKFKNIVLSYVFRFNSLQMILLCWDDAISDADLMENKIVLAHQYPYKILESVGCSEISRCTSEATYHQEKIIDVIWGQSIMDEISYMRGIFSEKHQKFLSSVEAEWSKEEERLAKEHPR